MVVPWFRVPVSMSWFLLFCFCLFFGVFVLRPCSYFFVSVYLSLLIGLNFLVPVSVFVSAFLFQDIWLPSGATWFCIGFRRSRLLFLWFQVRFHRFLKRRRVVVSYRFHTRPIAVCSHAHMMHKYIQNDIHTCIRQQFCIDLCIKWAREHTAIGRV